MVKTESVEAKSSENGAPVPGPRDIGSGIWFPTLDNALLVPA